MAFALVLLARAPVNQFLSPKLFDIERRTAMLSHRAELSRPPDARDYHGGIIATLIDMAAHICLARKLGRRVPTIDLRVDHLRPVPDTDLTATARIVRCVFSTRED